ncbi:nucleotidyltransferase domain-containing protein [Streptosporangium sandarakinum]
MFEASDVIEVIGLLHDGGCRVWVGGGWGIDALVGEVTRPHRDLDLMHDATQEPTLIEILENTGFAERHDIVPGRPARFVMRHPDGRELDLHPLTFQPDGSAVQPANDRGDVFPYPANAFATGTILGTSIACLSVRQQVHFHQGYEPTDRDRHDMAQLRRIYGIATHF